MAREYTKVEHLAEIVKAKETAGETNRAIAESYGLTLKRIKQLVNRQNRKERPVVNCSSSSLNMFISTI